VIAKSELNRLGITEPIVAKVCEPTVWSAGNQVLYDLCRMQPKHESKEISIAKVWIIGRTYAAAIERGAPNAGNQFYETKVGPKMVDGIDSIFEPLRTIQPVADNNLSEVMEAYNLTNELLRDIAGKERRSLSSKYLHFHFPNLYYLYDSRALGQIKQLTDGVGKNLPDDFKRGGFDPVYTRFYLRCWRLVRSIHKAYGIRLTPRQLDNLLLKRDLDQKTSSTRKKNRK